MKWWKEAVVYQIYPRSFKDSNGDGIGDIPGIISKLDYLHELGVTVIWLCPVYASPNDDNGYDISDYRAIHPDFGIMADMEELIQKASQLGIKIVMDLVVNHTSDEHEWFKEAKKSKDSPYRDYYIWRDPVDGNVPNNIKSVFSGPAWEYDEQTEQYYLHLFSKKQPDLNWQNPKVREEVHDMMNFWLEKGIGGFRLDVIEKIGKEIDQNILDNGPKLHNYIQEMNQKTFGNYDVMTVGETWAADIEQAILYSSPDRNEFSMVFQFEHITLDEQENGSKWDLKPLNIVELKQTLAKWQVELDGKGWNSLFWNNHDLPRIVSRWGNDDVYRVRSAQMFAILLHLMKGTPYIYQGEEIGMTNMPIKSIDEADDVESINLYHERLEAGYSKDDILESINTKGRDNARTPMQWTNDEHAGFTTDTPWLKVNPNYETINVEADMTATNSIFKTYQTLIQLRKDNPIVINGKFNLLMPDHPSIFAYTRTLGDEEWIVITNISDEPAKTEGISLENQDVLMNNMSNVQMSGTDISLEPYQAIVLTKSITD
mgnify:CR=1 FL=1